MRAQFDFNQKQILRNAYGRLAVIFASKLILIWLADNLQKLDIKVARSRKDHILKCDTHTEFPSIEDVGRTFCFVYRLRPYIFIILNSLYRIAYPKTFLKVELVFNCIRFGFKQRGKMPIVGEIDRRAYYDIFQSKVSQVKFKNCTGNRYIVVYIYVYLSDKATCKILKLPCIDFVSQSQFKGYPQHIRIFMYEGKVGMQVA